MAEPLELSGATEACWVFLFSRAGMVATRGHRFRVLGNRYRGEVRGKFFTQRVVGAWNRLPAVVVEADSLVSLKRLLDKYMEISKMEGYRYPE